MFDRVYTREATLWVVVMVLATAPMWWIAHAFPAGSPWRILALTPYLLGMLGMYWTELRQIARMDELQRLIYLVGTLSGSVFFTMFCALAFVGEILHLWPRVAPIWGIAAMGFGFGVGLLVAKWRYAG